MEVIKTIKADLENKRLIFREIGLLTALVVIYFVFNLKSFTSRNTEIEFDQQIDLTEELVPVTVQETKPPAPPPPLQASKITIVENDVDTEEDIEINVAATQETVIAEYLPFVSVEEEEEEVREEQIFVIVESMPSFPGGNVELMRYLQSQLKYPTLAKESGISGRVFVSFVVEKNGSVSDIKILRGIGGGCDEEAIRVVESMPKWIPGTQRNHPVRVRFNLPIKFTLQ